MPSKLFGNCGHFLLLDFSTLQTPETWHRKAKEIRAGESLGVILPGNGKKAINELWNTIVIFRATPEPLFILPGISWVLRLGADLQCFQKAFRPLHLFSTCNAEAFFLKSFKFIFSLINLLSVPRNNNATNMIKISHTDETPHWHRANQKKDSNSFITSC